MTGRMKVWSLVLLACLVLTVLHIPHLEILWREYKSISSSRINTGGHDLSKIKLQELHTDPEIEDILQYLINGSELDSLADLVVKYPDNELFRFELCNKLFVTDIVDSCAALVLADDLVRRQPDNAHYHYLKAYALFKMETESVSEQAIQELETANSLPKLEYAYAAYKKILLPLIESKEAILYQIGVAGHTEAHFYLRLSSAFAGCIRRAAIRSDWSLFERLANDSSKAGDKILENASDPFAILIASLFLEYPCQLQLKYAQLSPSQIEKARFHYVRAKAVKDIYDQSSGGYLAALPDIVKTVGGSFFALTVFACVGLFWFFIKVVSLFMGRAGEIKIPVTDYLRFASAFSYYILFVSILNYDPNDAYRVYIYTVFEEPPEAIVKFFFLPVIIWAVFRGMSYMPPYGKKNLYRYWLSKAIICASIWFGIMFLGIVSIIVDGDVEWQDVVYGTAMWSLTCIALWVVLVYGWFVARIIPYKKLMQNRSVQLCLLAMFFAGLNQYLIDEKLMKLLPLVLLVFYSSIIIVRSKLGELPLYFDAVFHFVDKRIEVVAMRAKISRLLSPYIVILWVIFLFTAGSIVPLLEELRTSFVSSSQSFQMLPHADKNTYESIVKKIDLNDVDDSTLLGSMRRNQTLSYLPVLGEKELSTVLESSRKGKRAASDSEIINLISQCGADVYDVLVDALEYPETRQALIARAKKGDGRVKPQLQKLFEKMLKSVGTEDLIRHRDHFSNFGSKNLIRCLDMAGALAVISDSNEAAQRFIDVMQQCDIKNLKKHGRSPFGRYLYRNLEYLPRAQASIILKEYLMQSDFYDISSRRNLSELENVLNFADTELAEQVFLRICNVPLMKDNSDLGVSMDILPAEFQEILNEPHDMAPQLLKAISLCFDKSSIPVLEKQLDTDNPAFCAYLVSTLTQLGYQWPKERLKIMLKHQDWKVRMNTLFAADKDSVSLALDDENSLVRVVAESLLHSRSERQNTTAD